VQHHHAHLAACLAEHGLNGPALGIIWDGTGYGPDGSIWGGEFLLGDAAGFTRAAHLRPFRLPGGDAAVKEPRRVALALLWEIYGEAALDRVDLPAIRAINPTDRQLLGQMLRKNINSPVTTSAGRLFDGVAALAGLHPQVSFEGQAAMALEFAADPHETGAYPVTAAASHQPDTPILLDWQPMIEAVLADAQHGAPVGVISARFHHGLVQAMVAVARQVGQPRVALSGGCFQNRRLTEQAAHALRQAGFEVLLHRHVPPNDGGISLGQIVVAAAVLKMANSKFIIGHS
jgi:hydrogenase maturation protein HypF